MKRRVRATKVVAAPTRISVDDRSVRNRDGWPIQRGDVMRRPVRFSKTLGVNVPGVVGKVVDIYRRADDGPVLVDLLADAAQGACGRYTALPGDLVDSEARVSEVC